MHNNNSSKRHLKIGLMIDLPPSPEQTAAHRRPSIEERVEDAMCLCESDHETPREWEFLRNLHNKLMKHPKLNKRQKKLMDKLTAFLRKHKSASGGHVEVDTEKADLFEELD